MGLAAGTAARPQDAGPPARGDGTPHGGRRELLLRCRGRRGGVDHRDVSGLAALPPGPIDIVLAEGGHRTDAVYFVMSEPDVQAAMQTWWVAVNTDFGGVAPDGPLGTQSAHPRAYGSFARILGHYVRELKLFPLEFAVRKMTSLAAQRVGLRDRGLLAPGMAADITIFDPNTVADRATFERPHQPSVGFAYVFVNGEKVLDHGKLTAARPGRGLRGPGYVPPERRRR
ncbi:MAG: hypothetical protein DMD69_14505 [Gemmatimonadetes bacterium]|nr:MAG: hypothetical protein DMD69_14505 [Gemmatimonadota bacterium]